MEEHFETKPELEEVTREEVREEEEMREFEGALREWNPHEELLALKESVAYFFVCVRVCFQKSNVLTERRETEMNNLNAPK